ncbi:MAG: alpha/beta hydrolase [Bacteroidota bacterium]
MTRICFLLLLLPLSWTCRAPEFLPGPAVQEQLYLEHKGAQMPVVIEGNSSSQTFVIVIHGGPGGNAMIYNDALSFFSDPLEEEYAMVYWDQRGSGNSLGTYDRNLVELSQYVEDLDVLVDFLLSTYGNTSSIFLMGHSWGGILGTAYLADTERQAKIKGWIEVDGAHNFPLINATAPGLLVDMGGQQIAEGNRTDEWEAIVDYCAGLPSVLSNEEALRVNQFANQVEGFLPESGLTALPPTEVGDVLHFFLNSNHNFVTATSNQIQTSLELGDKILQLALTEELKQIQLPALFLWGRYDFVVPLVLGEEALETVSTPEADKSLVIFERSGHSPMAQEPDLFVSAVQRFVEKYR